ncbi:MAG: DUF4331 family protein [Vicinamibacterales bacterium]
MTSIRRAIVLTVLLLAILPARASDHIDNPGVVLEPATDLTDLFATIQPGRDPNGPHRLTLVLNAFLGAPQGASFSDAVTYEIHLFAVDPSTMKPAARGHDVFACRFSAGRSQTFSCELTNEKGASSATVRGSVNRIPRAGKVRVFTGSRRDPFYLDDSNVQAKRTAGGDTAMVGTNATRFNDVLAIVTDLDLNVLSFSAPVLGIYGQVVLEREIAGAIERRVIDRVGRPEITNVTMRADDAKFLWNHEETLRIGSSKFRPLYRKTLRDGILGLDALDGTSDWTDQPAVFDRLLDILEDDYLWLNTTSIAPRPHPAVPNGGQYFSMEWARLQGGDPMTMPGGRGLGDDIMDVMLTLEVSGLDGPARRDGVDAAAVAARNEFPYLNPPFLSKPRYVTADADWELPAGRALAGLPAMMTDPPLSRRQLPTSDSLNFANNFNLRIASLEAQVEATGHHTLLTCALLGSDYQTRGQYTETLADFRRVLNITDECLRQGIDLYPIHALRSIAQVALHQYPDGFRSLETALAKGLDPGRFFFLAQAILWELGDRRNAFGIVAKAAEARPSVPTLLRKAVVLAEMGNGLESEQAFVQAQGFITDPNPFLAAWINTQRGRYRLAAGKPQEARAFFAAALERFPALPHAQEGLALAFEAEGNPKEAEARLRRLVSRNPDDLRAHLSLFLLQKKDGRANAATSQALSDRFARAAGSPELSGLLAAEFFISIGELDRADKLIEAEIARSAGALQVVKQSAALKAIGIVVGDGPGNPRALLLRDTLRAKQQRP